MKINMKDIRAASYAARQVQDETVILDVLAQLEKLREEAEIKVSRFAAFSDLPSEVEVYASSLYRPLEKVAKKVRKDLRVVRAQRRALVDALNNVDDEMADALAALDSEEARR